MNVTLQFRNITFRNPGIEFCFFIAIPFHKHFYHSVVLSTRKTSSFLVAFCSSGSQNVSSKISPANLPYNTIQHVQCVPHLNFVGFSDLAWFHFYGTVVSVIVRFYQLRQQIDATQGVFGCKIFVYLVFKCSIESLRHRCFKQLSPELTVKK